MSIIVYDFHTFSCNLDHVRLLNYFQSLTGLTHIEN